MSLILRNTKGSPLTYTEMDDNLTYLKSLTNSVDITYIDLMSDKTGNSLEPGTRYFITDRDIWIDALDTDKLTLGCKRHFRIVKDEFYTPHIDSSGGITNNYLGIYGQTINRGSVPNSDGTTVYFTIYGGRMWMRDTTGADVPGTSHTTIAGGWSMVNITDDLYYESKIFDIKYNFDDDIIWEQSDDRGNIIRRLPDIYSGGIDITDWGNTNIYNNQCGGIFNNFKYGSIAINSNNGAIFNNQCYNIFNNSNNGNIYNNSNNGDIYYNSNISSIDNNSNTGDILGNSNNGGIDNNSNTGDIQFNSNSGYIFGNSNGGGIQNNTNNGAIISNSNSSGTTHIRYNTNTGWIRGNIMNGTYLLEYNNNNGNIGVASGTVRNADITDTIVNKS